MSASRSEPPPRIAGRAFAPGSSGSEPAALDLDGDEALLTAADGRVLARLPRARLRFEAPVGRAPRRAILPDGTLFETEDRTAVARLDGASAGALLHRAERFHPRLAAVALACLVAAWLVWRYGLDLLVAGAVSMTPQTLVEALDAGALQSVDLALAGPSTRPEDDRAAAVAVFDRLVAALPPADRDGPRFALEFRDVPGVGPNAFALPGGTVVLTDAFLAQFPEPDIRAAVLAHELGHVVGAHGLRQVYRSLGAVALVALMAGETGPVLEDVLLEGNLLLSLRYSRNHERAADAFSLDLAARAGYDPAALVAFLERIAGGAGEGPDWASTHPATDARIDAARRALAPQ